MADNNNWEPYEEYRYPYRERRHPPRVSGDTIVRSPRKREVPPPSGKPSYCLDRCHHPNISTAPMFRPFALDDEWDANYYHVSDLDRTRTEYDIEIVKKHEQVAATANGYRRETSMSASFFRKDGHTYYRLKHGDEYGVKMINNTGRYVNALLKIDSDTMGKWRIGPYSSVTIERPAHNSRKFVFVKEESDEAAEGGVRQGKNSGANGLVEVTFTPMIDRRPDNLKSEFNPLINSAVPQSYSSANALTNSRGMQAEYAMNSVTESDSQGGEEAYVRKESTSQYGAGATALGEDSEQRFREASRYFVEDKDAKMTKRVRLVIDNRKRFTSIRDRDNDDNSFGDPVPPKLGQSV